MGRKQDGDPEGCYTVDAEEKVDEVKTLPEDRDTWRKMTHQPADREDGT